jgi:hypothetical protein
VLKETAGVELPPPERKTIDLEGRLVKDAVRKAVTESQAALVISSMPLKNIGSFPSETVDTARVGICSCRPRIGCRVERAERLMQA